jgi:hypothetical protein
MSSWTFVGRILPERVPLKIGTPLSSSNEVEALDLAYDCCIGIADSQVYADITVTRGNPNLNTLRNLAEGSIRAITDLIGYLHGMSFDVDIVSAISRETGELPKTAWIVQKIDSAAFSLQHGTLRPRLCMGHC